MRCNNCGWENPAGIKVCVKCNSLLSPCDAPASVNAKATVLESSGQMKNLSEDYCNCNYPSAPGMTICPACGKKIRQGSKVTSPIADKHVQKPAQGNPMKQTVNNWMNPEQGSFCTLKPIAWNNEGKEYEQITYSGEEIILNRANTDPNNNSITSKEQAALSFENGEWFIDNRSEQQTTFLKVSKKMKIESGDVIVLGNRLFEFKA